MFPSRFKVDYALVGERDGFSGRRADAKLWRKESYRRGYADGLLASATRAPQSMQVGAATKATVGREARR
ncbi:MULTISPECIES: hypothetical protein [unclassified Thiomonas]|uniref:hypothetical protein n=1 Tax=unclassified Thiomonas TaxID=2625466 RepID=UPI0004DBA1A3|nr:MULTISPECIES: hypothetical protein [unclassified Thiomonas]CDW96302.1 hypothetical protein THICB2_770003 [Thiomonas sp. CB2]VDY06763.1 protein of unknown function [Thiomonas sp. Bio17B3]VDY09940.1 protein of unknown function [Thiomonas sp. Sup16B3]VDY11184.1 protein of unknown function [Thiomonas sp. Sup16B3]VDY11275.1 protein of unknown function [Thiomonas sp. Bio17B3]